MSVAYVDASAVAAIAFGEPQGRDISGLLAGVDRLISSNLLEAELGSAFAREGMGFPPRLVSRIDWVFPERPLTGQLATALDAGYLRGAALWHVATALYVAVDPGEMFFVTLDGRQREVARTLGFAS